MAIRAVVFDAVGTLFHSSRSISEVYATVGREFGAQVEATEIARRFTPAYFRHFGRPQPGDSPASTVTSEELERNRWRQVVSDVFEELPHAGGELFERLWDHFAQGAAWQLFPDVRTTWDELTRRGYRLAIGSNYDRRLLSVLRDLPPLNDCEWVFHSAGVGHSKPGVQFFRHVEQATGLLPEELLFVGDDWNNDYLGATHAGWSALWLDQKPTGTSPPRPESASRRVTCLAEVVEWLVSTQTT